MTIDTTDLGMKKYSAILLALVFFLPFSASASIGVSPGFIDLGEVESGTTQEIDFYVTTNVGQEFVVEPEYEKSTKFIGSSGIQMRNVSEQDISSWIEFTQDTYNINPSTSETYELPNGATVNAEGVITMRIEVPPNAEPGYRLGELEINPSVSGEGSGAGARVFGQTVPGFAFRTPGKVDRDIRVSDVRAIRIGENQVQLIGRIGNEGTVTAGFNGAEINVTDASGQKVGYFEFPPAVLSPGEYAEISGTWSSVNVQGGEYSVEGIGNYETGETYISGNFAITSAIQEKEEVDEPSGGRTEESGSESPLTMIIMLSMLLGVLLYIMEIDLMWVVMIMGSTAVSLFVLFGTASNYLLLIPVMSIALMLYV